MTATQGTWYQLIMPAFVLASASVAYIARLMRANLAENLRADYVRTAKAKGLTNARTVGVHTLRNSLIPVVTFIGIDIGALMGGAIVTERIFNINGIGNFSVPQHHSEGRHLGGRHRGLSGADLPDRQPAGRHPVRLPGSRGSP